MEIMERLEALKSKASDYIKHMHSEDATKASLVSPFLRDALGYDVENPTEVALEHVADFGSKKLSKVDYAILKDGEPIFIIEAKHHSEPLEKHIDQLIRYFAAGTAKIAILTNGMVYRFYTDIDNPGRMDSEPFFLFDIRNFTSKDVAILSSFHKHSFSLENIKSAAETIRYTYIIREYFEAQLHSPSSEFVKVMISQAYKDKKTPYIVDKFKPLVKSVLTTYIADATNIEVKPDNPMPEGELHDQAAPFNHNDEKLIEITNEMLSGVIDMSLVDFKKSKHQSYLYFYSGDKCFALYCWHSTKHYVAFKAIRDKFTWKQVYSYDEIRMYKDNIVDAFHKFGS